MVVFKIMGGFILVVCFFGTIAVAPGLFVILLLIIGVYFFYSITRATVSTISDAIVENQNDDTENQNNDAIKNKISKVENYKKAKFENYKKSISKDFRKISNAELARMIRESEDDTTRQILTEEFLSRGNEKKDIYNF